MRSKQQTNNKQRSRKQKKQKQKNRKTKTKRNNRQRTNERFLRLQFRVSAVVTVYIIQVAVVPAGRQPCCDHGTAIK